MDTAGAISLVGNITVNEEKECVNEVKETKDNEVKEEKDKECDDGNVELAPIQLASDETKGKYQDDTDESSDDSKDMYSNDNKFIQTKQTSFRNDKDDSIKDMYVNNHQKNNGNINQQIINGMLL